MPREANLPSGLTKSALFVDFDNIYLGLKEVDETAAARFATNPDRWLEWLRRGMPTSDDDWENATPVRSILVRRCYLNPRTFQNHRPFFTRAAFSVVDCPPLTQQGKTSTDIHMVMDVLDALEHKTWFDEFIILSGDADFTPVLLRLRSHDRRTVVLTAGPSAPAYRAACDEVITDEVFVDHALGLSAEIEPEPAPSTAQLAQAGGSEELLDLMAAQLESSVAGGEIEAMDLWQIYVQFSEFTRDKTWLGFGTLRRLTLELIRRRPTLRLDERSDTWYVTGRSEVAVEAQPRPALASEALSEDISRDALEDRIRNRVREIVQRSDAPVPMSTVGNLLMEEFGREIKESHWAGHRSLSNLLMIRSDTGFSIALDTPPGYVYDPQRHAAPAAREPRSSLNAKWPHLADLAGRVSRLTGTPSLTPTEYATVFRCLGEDLKESPYHLSTTSKSVRDHCIEEGSRIARLSVSFIIKGIVYNSGLPDQRDSAGSLSAKFVESVTRRCEDAGLNLSDEELGLLREWIQGEVPSEE